MLLFKSAADEPSATADDVAQSPYQIFGLHARPSILHPPLQLAIARAPARPLCAEDFAQGVWRQPKRQALGLPYVQLNSRSVVGILTVDNDRSYSRLAIKDSGLPVPNYGVLNPQNGRGHWSWVFEAPVPIQAGASAKTLHALAAAERGIVEVTGSDATFGGNLTKSPLSDQWALELCSPHLYELGELIAALPTASMRWKPTPVNAHGYSRNCWVFDELRRLAYGKHGVRRFKTTGASVDTFTAHLFGIAQRLNAEFPQPLSMSELRSLSKSIAKWTWLHFSPEKLSAIQSRRGAQGAAKRWSGHVANEIIKPWLSEGISRRTWYRRRGKP